MSPSLSKSPKAQPRLACGGLDAGAGLPDQLFEFALAQVAEDDARRAVGGLRNFGIDAAGDQEKVGVAVVIEV